MATTENTFTQGSGDPNTRSFTFPYIKKSDVKVSVAGVDKTEGTGSDQWQWSNATTIQFNTTPATGSAIRIYRATDDSALAATFYAGSSIKSADLNDNFLQNLYTTQEVNNNSWQTGSETIDSSETWAGDNTKVATTGAIDARIDSKIDTALTTDIVGNNQINIQDNHPSSGKITVAITGGSITDAQINSSAAIAGTKISPDFGSQNIATSGTVDGRDVSVDGVKLDGIDAGAKDDQTAAEIRALVESASDSNVFTDADHSKLNAMDANAADDQTAAEIKTLIASSPLDNSHLAADSVRVSEIKDGEITAAKLNAATVVTNSEQASATANDTSFFTTSASDARYFNVSTGDTIKDGDTFPDNDTTIATTAAINDRIIDLVDDVGGFVPIANETSFPNANPDVNNGAGTLVSIKALSSNLTSNGSGVATIANGTVGNSTVTITGLANSTTYAASFGMIVETTTTLNTYTFHRQVPKATEVTTVAGSISNVNTVAGNNANISTVAGATSNISTVAGSITNVNNVGGSISNVNSVASNLSTVNDFAARYRVASSAPSSSLDAGDLYFDTSSNELRVYNGSAWQGGVTATGNLAGLGANTFTGSQSHGDDVKNIFGTGNDLSIFHNGTNSEIDNDTGLLYLKSDGTWITDKEGSDNMAKFVHDAGVQLFFDNTKKFETTSEGVTVSGHLDIDDNNKIKIGTGDDLEIYHDATDNQIKSTNGKVIITTTAGNSDIEITPNGSGNVKLDGLSWPNADGSANQFLKTDGSGALSFAAPGGGAWEVVSSTVLTNGCSQTLDLNGWSSAYQNYRVIMNGINKNGSGCKIYLRFYMDSSHSSTGTGTLKTSDKYEAVRRSKTASTGNNSNSEQYYYELSNDTAHTYWHQAEITIPQVTFSGSSAKACYSDLFFMNASYFETCYYDADDTEFIKGVQLYWASNTTDLTGRVTLLRQKYS